MKPEFAVLQRLQFRKALSTSQSCRGRFTDFSDLCHEFSVEGVISDKDDVAESESALR